MNAQLIVRIVGIFTAGLVLIVGAVILAGSFMPAYIPEQYRWLLGVIMVVYGTYRIAIIWVKQRRDNREQEQA
jgi:predicted tellurium resistance membrane protein TerC